MTSAKAGSALEKLESVSFAFIDAVRIVLLCSQETVSKEAIANVLAEFDAKPEGLTRDDSLLF